MWRVLIDSIRPAAPKVETGVPDSSGFISCLFANKKNSRHDEMGRFEGGCGLLGEDMLVDLIAELAWQSE